MKDIILKSGNLVAHVNPFGAELKGLALSGLEYLWQGDVDTYPRTSPTLFPIIGRFLSDTYFVGDQPYRMTINGFAQDENFTVVEHSETSVSMLLTANARTRAQYPFEFNLIVTYTLEGDGLIVQHTVQNCGANTMPFCIGCHTAYKWPLFDTDTDTDYYLQFEQAETLQSFNPFGWEAPFLDNADTWPLRHDHFRNYTRSIKHIRSGWVELACAKHGRGVRIDRREYPFMAIWSLPTADATLICLEPCTSLHPGTHPSLYLSQRDGALELSPGEQDTRSFTIALR